MDKLKFSYFQLTFGQKETYLHPEITYKRLKDFGYDAIELTPPKGRYGIGMSMENYLAKHKKLKEDFQLEISCVNECWGEEWDPYSPHYKTLTEPKTADFAVSETKKTTDFASELEAPFVTVLRFPTSKSSLFNFSRVVISPLAEASLISFCF